MTKLLILGILGSALHAYHCTCFPLKKDSPTPYQSQEINCRSISHIDIGKARCVTLFRKACAYIYEQAGSTGMRVQVNGARKVFSTPPEKEFCMHCIMN
jgi:hypothetical protein